MPYRRIALLIGLTGLSACAPPAPPPGPVVPVAVEVTCTGADVDFKVRPWYLELNQGDQVDWLLADPQQSIEIRKASSAWPFQSNKFNGNRADPPTSRAMKGGQGGKHFRYAIAVTCQGPEGPRTVVLDPDMYIKR
jgi:hypothetical protein